MQTLFSMFHGMVGTGLSHYGNKYSGKMLHCKLQLITCIYVLLSKINCVDMQIYSLTLDLPKHPKHFVIGLII